MNQITSFFKRYKAYIAFTLCFILAVSFGYTYQKNHILEENRAAEQTQAFVTEGEDRAVEEVNHPQMLPEAFPDSTYTPEPPVTLDEKLPTAKNAGFSPSMPVTGALSKGYSTTPLYSLTLDDWRSHEAIDIAADEGDVVHAIEQATVTAVGRDPLLGVYIRLQHEDGFESLYANLHSEITVIEGQNIEKGHIIGYIGSSSLAEQAEVPHLHFELLKDNLHVDPRDYIQ